MRLMESMPITISQSKETSRAEFLKSQHWLRYEQDNSLLCDCPVSCRIFSRRPSCYPRDASSTSSQLRQPKMSPGTARCPWREVVRRKHNGPGLKTTGLDVSLPQHRKPFIPFKGKQLL